MEDANIFQSGDNKIQIRTKTCSNCIDQIDVIGIDQQDNTSDEIVARHVDFFPWVVLELPCRSNYQAYGQNRISSYFY